jgi:hypothetical protein
MTDVSVSGGAKEALASTAGCAATFHAAVISKPVSKHLYHGEGFFILFYPKGFKTAKGYPSL